MEDSFENYRKIALIIDCEDVILRAIQDKIIIFSKLELCWRENYR